MQSSVDLVGLLRHLLQMATTSSEPDMLLARIAMAVGRAFHADGCMIALSVAAPPGARMACWVVGSEIPIVFQSCSPSKGFAKRLNSPATIAVPDVHALTSNPVPGFTEDEVVALWQSVLLPVSAPPLRSLLEVPTQIQGTVHGVISLMRSQPYSWHGSNVVDLETVAQQVAVIVSQVPLRQQIKQQSQFQAVVNQLTMAIRNSSEAGEILKLATDGTAQALQVQRGMLLRLKYWDPLFRTHPTDQIPKVRVVVTCEWFNSSEESTWQSSSFSSMQTSLNSVLNQSFWLSDCEICQQAFTDSPEPTVIDHKPPSASENTTVGASVLNLTPTDALLIAPLESQGTILGFLVFQDSQPRSWQPEEIELVKLVSAQVSTAIIQTETLRQVQSLVEKRTAELQQSLSIQAKLYERTRQQLDQLRHLNQLKDEFLDTVSHELRTPLTSMALAIRMLRQVGPDSDRSDRYLDILEQQCMQETSLVNDLLALQELESKQVAIQLEEINLTELLTDLATAFHQKWAIKGLMLGLGLPTQPITIQSDRDSLNRICLELLTNAGKYSDPNSVVNLTLADRHQEPSDQVVLTLTNRGAGISSEELPYIFDRFRRCQSATQNVIQGTGLGLALVKSLVQHLNGTISASSYSTTNPQIWETCFTLILPQTLEQSKL